MNKAAMAVRVIMHTGSDGQGAAEAGEIPATEQDQHQANRKLHCQAKASGNDDIKENDCAAHDEDRQRVTEAPENTDQGRTFRTALLADDGSYSDDVIGIGGMPHTQKEADRDD